MEDKYKWEYRFIKIAEEVAKWSKDKSRKVGALIVKEREIVSTGYNGMPRGCFDDKPERNERPEKYYWYIHAEANAIINAARQGKSTLNCDIYINLFPCCTCAGFIVQAGIKRVFCNKKPDFNDPTYGESYKRSVEILNECGVEIIYL